MLQSAIVTNTKELEQVLELQQQYLRGQTNATEEKEQGFLTVAHTLDLLQKMDALEHSIIVKDENALAGYALAMPKECRAIIPVLVPMFENFDDLLYLGKPVNNYSFYVMGQICVAKRYRGQGVFDMLYQKHRENFKNKYDFVITEISTRNLRSLRAHERIGFKTLCIYTDATDEWAVVIWDWD
jgi:GNAT superfamily N-acetyltransferase